MCSYWPHPDSPVCPAEDQRRLLEHFLGRADNGSTWAANMLRMTPCDLWWAPLHNKHALLAPLWCTDTVSIVGQEGLQCAQSARIHCYIRAG